MSATRNVITAAAMFAGVAALATAALASSTHLSDSQYIAAAHCQGLFDAHTLGSADASGINSLMKSESAYRAPEILDRASEARTEAKGQADRAGSLMKSQLASERDGACQTWAKAGDVASGR